MVYLPTIYHKNHVRIHGSVNIPNSFVPVVSNPSWVSRNLSSHPPSAFSSSRPPPRGIASLHPRPLFAGLVEHAVAPSRRKKITHPVKGSLGLLGRFKKNRGFLFRGIPRDGFPSLFYVFFCFCLLYILEGESWNHFLFTPM